MDLSKLQIVALVILTTILTDKFLINHPSAPIVSPVTSSPTPTLSLSPIPTSQPNTSQNELILKEIQNLRKDMVTSLNNIQTKTGTPDAVPTFSSSLIGGMVKVASPQWPRVDVFEKANSSSKIINSIVYDTIYFYSTKSDGWYLLSLDGGQAGYVQSQFLKEFP